MCRVWAAIRSGSRFVPRQIMARELKKLDLTAVKSFHVRLDPFSTSNQSLRQVWLSLTQPLVADRTSVKINVNVVNDRSEPMLTANLQNGKKIVFHTEGMTQIEILRYLNKWARADGPHLERPDYFDENKDFVLRLPPDMRPIKICPSVLNADLAKLGQECENLLRCGADWLHLDVMDGHFVPNLSFGPPVVQSIRRYVGTSAFLDAHLMVSNPEMWLQPMADAKVDQFTFHLEALETESQVVQLVDKVKSHGIRCGVSIKPGTSVSAVLPLCHRIDNVLVMTVEPGFGGQSFMADMMDKVRELRRSHPDLDIQVDGGVGPSNIRQCFDAGANVFVSGTAIVRAPDPKATIQQMRELLS